MKLHEKETQILNVIKLANGEPIKQSEITNKTGCASRDVRVAVNNIRRKGIPICSSKDGYYLAKDINDIKKTITHLESRIKRITKAIDGLNLALTVNESEV